MMRSHFTATTFVVDNGRTLLHWHKKLQQWMPPGGHLLPDEDPVSGALREVREETGLRVELLPLTHRYDFDHPQQLAAPQAILLEEIDEPREPHQHIDLIYFARPIEGEALRPLPDVDSWRWVTEDELANREELPLADGGSAPVPNDVRELALAAIRAEGEAE
ncbi:MAG: NUDIX domain-containing protein [Chloroflexi bacterium]|nr:NUDIX domain-containing protein [Chloroflexota bacterium]